MKYFRALRLGGNEAIDEYYKFASELATFQNIAFKKKNENPEEDLSELNSKIEDIHSKMNEKYGMVPHLHYHAMAEKGFISELVNEETYKKLLKDGKVQEGQARKLELLKDKQKEIGFSIPIIKLDEPQAIKHFNSVLKKWEELKASLKRADNPTLKQSLEEQYEAFKKDLKEKYKMNPQAQYVFETTEVGIYMGCTEEHLSKIAEWQKTERAEKAQELWEKHTKEN